MKNSFETPGADVESQAERIDSMDVWYDGVVGGNIDRGNLEKMLIEATKRDVPKMCTVTMERFCNLQCTHCVYQPEKSSKKISENEGLGEIVENIVRQLPEHGTFLHGGRVLMPWHLDVLERIREIRPDVELSLLDNGTYTRYIKEFEKRGLKLDSIDISVDGTEESHNNQRDPKHRTSYKEAMNGLRRAREIVRSPEEGGRVSSLFTLTKHNFRDIEATAETLFAPNPATGGKLPLVDLMPISTIGPYKPEHLGLEVSPLTDENFSEFKLAWEQMKRVSKKYNTEGERFTFSIYRLDELEKLTRIVGEKQMYEALTGENVGLTPPMMGFRLEGVPINFTPLSAWPSEEFGIDADGSNILVAAFQYSLKELRSGKAKDGTDTSAYTNARLTKDSNFVETYEREVDAWWERFARQHLDKEIAFFKKLREEAEKEA